MISNLFIILIYKFYYFFNTTKLRKLFLYLFYF